jgi:hypothetical protein
VTAAATDKDLTHGDFADLTPSRSTRLTVTRTVTDRAITLTTTTTTMAVRRDSPAALIRSMRLYPATSTTTGLSDRVDPATTTTVCWMTTTPSADSERVDTDNDGTGNNATLTMTMIDFLTATKSPAARTLDAVQPGDFDNDGLSDCVDPTTTTTRCRTTLTLAGRMDDRDDDSSDGSDNCVAVQTASDEHDHRPGHRRTASECRRPGL